MELEIIWLGLKVLAVVLGTYVFVFCFVKKINEWRYVTSLGDEKKNSLPPGDMGWLVFGNMLPFLRAFYKSNDPDSFVRNMVQRYGRIGIYKTHLFGTPTIIVSTPETCRRVLMDDERFALGFPESTRLLTSKWFHTLNNSEHKRVRRLIKAPINGHEELAMYIGYIEESMVNSLDEWSSMNEPIQFLKEIKQVTFKVITQIFLGSTAADSIIGLVESHYVDLMQGLNTFPINIPCFSYYRALKARNMLLKIIQDVLLERKAKSNQIINYDPEERRAMIDLLMESEDENGQQLTDENIIDLLLIFLLAGHETSAYAIMWATIYLHDNPETLQKAKKEQQEILKKRPRTQKGLTLKDIREMNYLQKVIDETMRKSNLGFSIFREAKVDVNINGYLIPKGWRVLAWSREVHLDPEVYSNPKQFIPERWENNKPKAGSFLPFGIGSRICPGADLAKLEMTIFLHYFLLNYKLEQINPGSPSVYLPIPRPLENCLAKIVEVE